MNPTFPQGLAARIFSLVVVFAVFGAIFFLDTRNNRFPYFYHTDEPSKAEQLVSGERNFFHPALMLNATAAISHMLHVPWEDQSMVVVGRHLSAFFVALAAVGFGLVAWHLAGPLAGLLAAIFCGISPDFFDAAHYMKEDPYWISGLAFTFLAALNYWRKPSWWLAIALGLTSGWAVSGKYIGFIALLVAMLTIFGKMIASRVSRVGDFVLCALAAGILFLGINYQILAQPQTMKAGLGKEVGALYNEHHQKSEKFKVTRYLGLLVDTVPPAAIMLAAGILGWGLWNWRKRSLPELLFLVLPIFIGIALTLTPKGSARYFLPISLMLLTSAAVALVQLVKFCQKWPRFKPGFWMVGVALALAVLLPLGKEFQGRRRAFTRDYHLELADFIRKNIAPTAVLAADQRAAMPSADDPRYAGFPNLLPQRMLITRYTADLGDLDTLLARGISYVVVAGRDANRLANDGNFSAEDQKKLPQRRKFYQDLAERGTFQWQRKLGENKYLNVSLILYRIAPAQ